MRRLAGQALFLRGLFLCLVAGLLAGCEALPVRENHFAPRPAPADIAAFSFDGRISARQGETSHHANIAWRHTPDDDEILLTTPLGQGVAELTRGARGARLVGADRQVFEAPDWEGLSARLFGFELPLTGLPRWVLGDVPSAGRGAQLDAARVAGWDIRYLDRESDAPGALPVLIEFRRDDIELRLKVDEWHLE